LVRGFGGWQGQVTMSSSWWEQDDRGWDWGQCGCGLEVSGTGGLTGLFLVAANILSDRLVVR